MNIKRQSTFGDKCVSFFALLVMCFIGYNVFRRYQVVGQVSSMDVMGIIICLGLGIFYMYTSRLTYMVLDENELVWYTWFLVKHKIEASQIKDVVAKTHYIIIVKQNNKEIWIPIKCLSKEDMERMLPVLKGYIKKS